MASMLTWSLSLAGIGSWFRTNAGNDHTNGQSWCQTWYQVSLIPMRQGQVEDQGVGVAIQAPGWSARLPCSVWPLVLPFYQNTTFNHSKLLTLCLALLRFTSIHFTLVQILGLVDGIRPLCRTDALQFRW